jgi:hypothetical protein
VLQNGKRRRLFNYQQYYSDLILQVSDRACEMETPGTRNRNQPSAAPVKGESGSAAEMAAHLHIISEQRSLIEEQLRLIREQTRLIEEKTKLIQEKNKVLEQQSDLFGNQVF